jgi:hypothetical protein
LAKTKLRNSLDLFKNATDYICRLNLKDVFIQKYVFIIYRKLNFFLKISVLNTNETIDKNTLVTICFLNTYIIDLFSQYNIKSFDNLRIVEDINGKTVN